MNEFSPSMTNLIANALLQAPIIGEHSIKVTVLSNIIADIYFEDEDSVLFTSVGGILHDIGFILPRYTEDIFEYSCTEDLLDLEISDRGKYLLHTTIGGYILSNFLGMYEYADVAFYHHTPASELDETSFTHMVSNIINLADTVVTRLERIDISLAKEIIPDILAKLKESFFPDVYEAALTAFKKDITWWWIEDSRYYFENYILPRLKSGMSDNPDLDSLKEVGHFLAYLVDAKSPFTRKHSERIAKLSYDLGCEYGMDERRCEELYVAGLFHDIGKIAIPLNILEKPAMLDKGEFWLMRKHVYYTGVLLKNFEDQGFEWPIWARQHHERLDGSGYPMGLSAEDLPLESKIMQICDVFVAFTEDRPYRKPLIFKDALEIIKKEVDKGKLDPDVFEKLENMVKNGYDFPKRTITEEIIETVEFLIENLR